MSLRTTLPWYGWLEGKLEPNRDIMVALALVLIAVTIVLILHGDSVVLAAWLAYLISP